MEIPKMLPSNQELSKKLNWISDDLLQINDVVFDLEASMERHREPRGDLSLSKSPPYVQSYFEDVDLSGTRNVLELGFFRGGSAAFFFELLDPARLVTVELEQRKNEEFERYHAKSQKRQERLKVFRGVDQQDAARLQEIFAAEFGDEPLDLVIDDASHFYQPTRKSFEVVFPRMRPGGTYIIEDWGWSHAPKFQGENGLWADQPALTNFIFELMMIHASTRWIEKIIVRPYMLAIVASAFRPDTEFSVDTAYQSRGKKPGLI